VQHLGMLVRATSIEVRVHEVLGKSKTRNERSSLYTQAEVMWLNDEKMETAISTLDPASRYQSDRDVCR